MTNTSLPDIIGQRSVLPDDVTSGCRASRTRLHCFAGAHVVPAMLYYTQSLAEMNRQCLFFSFTEPSQPAFMQYIAVTISLRSC